MVLGDKKGAEGGEGDHQNGDTTLGVVPEHDPCQVESGVSATQTRYLDYGRHDYEDAEAQRQAQAQFLARFNSDRPEQTHRYGNDQQVGQDVEAYRDGGEDEGLVLVRIVPALHY